MVRYTITTRDGGKVHGHEANAILAYKEAVKQAERCSGGGIITVDDLETTNTVFHTESIAEASVHA